MDDDALEPGISNYLAAVLPSVKKRDPVGLAWVELSTGQFMVSEVSPDDWLDELARAQPAEVLLPDSERGRALEAPMTDAMTTTVTLVSPRPYGARRGHALPERAISRCGTGGVRPRHHAPRASCGGRSASVSARHATGLAGPHHTHSAPRPGRRVDHGSGHTAAARSLTATGWITEWDPACHHGPHQVRRPGARLLREWMLAPRTDVATIGFRHDGVEEFVKDSFLRNDLRELAGDRSRH